MATFGMTAPVESAATPTRVPLVTCAGVCRDTSIRSNAVPRRRDSLDKLNLRLVPYTIKRWRRKPVQRLVKPIEQTLVRNCAGQPRRTDPGTPELDGSLRGRQACVRSRREM